MFRLILFVIKSGDVYCRPFALYVKKLKTRSKLLRYGIFPCKNIPRCSLLDISGKKFPPDFIKFKSVAGLDWIEGMNSAGITNRSSRKRDSKVKSVLRSYFIGFNKIFLWETENFIFARAIREKYIRNFGNIPVDIHKMLWSYLWDDKCRQKQSSIISESRDELQD